MDDGQEYYTKIREQEALEGTKAVPRVYVSIANVAAEFAAAGLAKTQKNQQQGFSFRGIDDVYNALAPMLKKHGLVILPRVLSHECAERESARGGALRSVVVTVAYDFVSVVDASSHTLVMVGEAMDSGDKATSKACSMAFKYACFEAFCIPIAAQDADSETHEIKRKSLPAYPDERLENNLPSWREAINSGNATPEQIIAKISSKAALSATQIVKINGLKHEHD